MNDRRKPAAPSGRAIQVGYYGIHWDGDTAWLQDGHSGSNAQGLAIRSPFVVKPINNKLYCNFRIHLSAPVISEFAWAYFLEIARDPVIQAMLPVPKNGRGLYWIEDPGGHYNFVLSMLARLSSPIYPTITAAHALKLTVARDLLQESNIQPLIYTGLTYDKAQLLHLLAKEEELAPRTLILTGASDVPVPPAYKKIKFSQDLLGRDVVELNQLPWESFGATVVRKVMRKEWPPAVGPDGRYVFVPPGKVSSTR